MSRHSALRRPSAGSGVDVLHEPAEALGAALCLSAGRAMLCSDAVDAVAIVSAAALDAALCLSDGSAVLCCAAIDAVAVCHSCLLGQLCRCREPPQCPVPSYGWQWRGEPAEALGAALCLSAGSAVLCSDAVDAVAICHSAPL